MSDKYIGFGDAKEQTKLYENLIQDVEIVSKKTKKINNVQLSFVLCRGKNTELICIQKKLILPLGSLAAHPRYWAYIIEKGKEKLLYGTIAELLYKQYAHGEKPITNLLQKTIFIDIQGKTK